MKAPQCGLSRAGIFMHSCYLDRNFLSNTLQLVLSVQFNLKKMVLKQSVSVLASLFCVFFRNVNIEHKRREMWL